MYTYPNYSPQPLKYFWFNLPPKLYHLFQFTTQHDFFFSPCTCEALVSNLVRWRNKNLGGKLNGNNLHYPLTKSQGGGVL